MIFYDRTHDWDSTKDVWDQLYDIVYRETFEEYFDFSRRDDKETSIFCKRWYIKIDKDKQVALAEKYPKFKMAGDCIFNFNHKKIKIFKELLQESDKGLTLLEQCHEKHHSLLNFSFMPITGGMNNKKGILRCENGVEKKAFDRLDIMISELNKYFKGEKNRVLGRYNKEALKWYLSLFEETGIEGYCKKIYFIESTSMIERILELAKRPICNKETAIDYMELAIDYWKMKSKKLKEMGISNC